MVWLNTVDARESEEVVVRHCTYNSSMYSCPLCHLSRNSNYYDQCKKPCMVEKKSFTADHFYTVIVTTRRNKNDGWRWRRRQVHHINEHFLKVVNLLPTFPPKKETNNNNNSNVRTNDRSIARNTKCSVDDSIWKYQPVWTWMKCMNLAVIHRWWDVYAWIKRMRRMLPCLIIVSPAIQKKKGKV